MSKPIEIYASCPGLLIAGSEVMGVLATTKDIEHSQTIVNKLNETQRMVAIRTGSPQLDYQIHVYAGRIPDSEQGALVAKRFFGLRVDGGEVVIVDGYWLEYLSEDYERASVPIADGYYQVEIGWSRATRHACMVLHLGFQQAVERVHGDGHVDLEFIV
jgi:hypothetical protein